MNSTLRPLFSTNQAQSIYPITAVDITLGTLYILISVIGILGNISAIIFYHNDNSSSMRREFFRLLFLLIAYVDLVSCTTLFPVIEVMLTGRSSPMMFSNNWFCMIWGIIWEVNPLLSVFLVALISFSRILTMLFPLKQLPDKKVLIAIVSGYLTYTLLAKTVPLADDKVLYKYFTNMGYCSLEPASNEIAGDFYQITNTFQLGFPFIPICISCAFSIALVSRKRISAGSTKSGARRGSSQKMLEDATVTIIIMTSVYLLFNIPVLGNFIYFTRYYYSDAATKYYDTVFLEQYIWNLTTIFTTVGNAACNPLVYLWRVRSYRQWLTGLFHLTSGVTVKDDDDTVIT